MQMLIRLPAALPLVLLLATPVLAQDWQGTMETRDGVTHVINPKTGVFPPKTLELDELWRLGGYSDAEEEFFGVITDVVTDGDRNVYLLDSQLAEVRVFDENGRYLRTVGREGEGPGEFRRPNRLTFFPDGNLGVIQPFPSRIVRLSPEGDPAGDYAYEPQGSGGGFVGLAGAERVQGNLALNYFLSEPGDGAFIQNSVLVIATPEGEEVRELIRAKSSMDYANSLCIETEWNRFDQCWTTAGDGRIFARPEFDQYRIRVWNPDGTVDRVITREYPPFARSGDAIDRIKERWARGIARWVKNPTFEIEKNWNPIEDVYGRADGTVWVRTSRGKWGLEPGILVTFDVYDAEGRYLQEVRLQGEFDPKNDGIFFTQNYVIVVTDLVSAQDAWVGAGDEGSEDLEQEPEPMTVICYRIDNETLAAN